MGFNTKKLTAHNQQANQKVNLRPEMPLEAFQMVLDLVDVQDDRTRSNLYASLIWSGMSNIAYSLNRYSSMDDTNKFKEDAYDKYISAISFTNEMMKACPDAILPEEEALIGFETKNFGVVASSNAFIIQAIRNHKAELAKLNIFDVPNKLTIKSAKEWLAKQPDDVQTLIEDTRSTIYEEAQIRVEQLKDTYETAINSLIERKNPSSMYDLAEDEMYHAALRIKERLQDSLAFIEKKAMASIDRAFWDEKIDKMYYALGVITPIIDKNKTPSADVTTNDNIDHGQAA